MSDLEERVKSIIRDIPDFPKPGIIFKDITPLLYNPKLCLEMTKYMVEQFSDIKIDAIIAIESRGFMIGTLMSQILDVPLVLVRKKGKLPYKTYSYKYDLEYGSSELEIHMDAVKPDWNVVIHDDLLATGGTANAAAHLINQCSGNVVGYSFLVNLSFLNGDKILKSHTSKMVNIATY